MLALALTVVAIFLGVHWLYPLAMTAKHAYRDGRITKYWLVILALPIALGVVLDFAFNYTFGFMFLAKPRPVLFSGTVQYHYRNSDGWRLSLALFWANQLNVFDEHIK